MQQYRLEFFENFLSRYPESRKLVYRHHDFVDGISIDDDYLSVQSTTVEIRATTKVKNGQILRVLRDDKDYFLGLVTNVTPGEYSTTVTFKPFIAIFDSDILFNINTQYWNENSVGISLEQTLKLYIEEYFANSDAQSPIYDYRQYYPLTVKTPSSGLTSWNMYILSDDDSVWTIVNLYSLIVRALKEYGVVISVSVNFSTGQIELNIGKLSGTRHIDADLDNVTVKTLKVNERPDGINKLIVHNALTYSSPYIFYVHQDRTWDTTNTQRITPVSYSIITVTPDGTYSDPTADFYYAASNAAREQLNGVGWDNLIELECSPNDPIVKPLAMRIGQQVAVHQKGDTYISILTGKNISLETVTLIFGSERITYTKRNR